MATTPVFAPVGVNLLTVWRESVVDFYAARVNRGADRGQGDPGSTWRFDEAAYDRMRSVLSDVADETVTTIIEQVPSYRGPFTGQRGQRIREAVQLALDVFLNIGLRETREEVVTAAMARATADAYDLGRGEARSGRSMEALHAAYRLGARVAWRGLSHEAVASGMPAEAVRQFADRVFAFIDELAGASVAGHADELETSGRVHERLLERIVRAVAGGQDAEELSRRAERAGWEPPGTLTAVLLPANRAGGVRTGLHPGTLQATGDVPGVDDDTALLLVPDVTGPTRATLQRRLEGRAAVIGPTRAWTKAHASVVRALRGAQLVTGTETVDTDDRLVDLVLLADAEAYDDLRVRVLAPLAQLRPSARARLEETLRSWLLHQGKREKVAQELFVHAQTVRYRMGRLRELFGESLEDPATVLAMTIALGAAPPAAGPTRGSR